jgi:tRNA pseudouridine13 synthase
VPETWRPPDAERSIGLGFYATTTPPVAGTIKADADDFVVREISSYPMPDPNGRFTVLKVRSRDWEQHELASRLGEWLGLPRNAIAWAGTKDRRAVADRLFSYRGDPPTGPVPIGGIEILETYRARDGLSLGHHYGNGFSVRVTDLPEPAAAEIAFRETVRQLAEVGLVPNLFGPQRFGEVRPITHLVGRALVAGDAAAAVEVYLAGLPDASGDQGRDARRAYAADHDARKALADFPRAYRFERQILERLARGAPPDVALRGLARELRLLFVHAVQSWMFNRWVTDRVTAGLSLSVPVAGDTLLRVARDGTTPSRDPIPVESGNLHECCETVRKGRARLAGPLIGYATSNPGGPVGDLLTGVLAETGVAPDGFRLPSFPELSSAGAWRPVTISTPPIGVRTDGAGVRLDFALPKGSYATVIVRELLKPGATLAPALSSGRF